MMQKILLTVLQLSFLTAGQQCLLACAPTAAPVMSVVRFQRAMDLVDQGTLLLRANRLDEAQGAFAAAVDLGPMPAAIDGLGCIAFMREDFLLAEKYFVEAYNLDKTYFASLGNLALLYELRGLSDKAIQLYRMALEAEPENFRTRNNIAVHLLDKGESQAAKEQLLKALALAKHPVVAANVLRLEEYE
jgi:tetratricopeptide (TPR) repeat protein